MKILALSAAALIATAPMLAQTVSGKTSAQQHSAQQHKVFKTRHQVVSGYAPWRANSLKTGYPGAYGYAPGAAKDYTYDNSRNAGGGGGGGM